MNRISVLSILILTALCSVFVALAIQTQSAIDLSAISSVAVSYTHLTLPTKA